MEEKDYISKIALSIEKEKLGVIIRVEGSATAVLISEKLHAIVKAYRLFFSPDYIHLPLGTVIEKTDTSIQFSISEDDFQKKKKIYRIERKNKAKLGKKHGTLEENYDKDIDNAVAKQTIRW